MATAQTSVLLEAMSGRAGQAIFVHGKRGTVVRNKPRAKINQDPKSRQARANAKTAAATWQTLDAAENAAWQAYAQTVERQNQLTGQTYTLTAYHAFMALATKVLQIAQGLNQTPNIPRTPPTTTLTPERQTFTLATTSGHLTITTTDPNTSDHSTEILLQPLANSHRKPIESRYRNAAFATFGKSESAVTIPLPAGTYALAHRIVKPTTGQQSPLTTLATITIP